MQEEQTFVGPDVHKKTICIMDISIVQIVAGETQAKRSGDGPGEAVRCF